LPVIYINDYETVMQSQRVNGNVTETHKSFITNHAGKIR
jgi:hypothetical protein